METYTDPHAALAIAERASAAPYVDYPPSPKWYPFAVGAWAGLMVLAAHGVSARPAVFLPLLLVLLAAEGAFIAWYRNYRQTMPSLRGAPREIDSAMRRYVAGSVVVLAVSLGSYLAFGPFVCAAVMFVLVTASLILYEREYARAAAATRDRLQRDA